MALVLRDLPMALTRLERKKQSPQRAPGVLSVSAVLALISAAPAWAGSPQTTPAEPQTSEAQSTTGQPQSAPAASEAATPDQDQAAPQDFALHGQATNVTQFHPRFRSPYQGPNSLNPGNRGDETVDLTAYLGVRPWAGGELWVNPEVDQGFGLSNTLGVAGFPSGEAYKIGKSSPYLRVQRLFLRQTFDLGGETEKVDPDLNQLAGTRTKDRVVLTFGRFAVTDVFDTNKYAHDPRGDFMNWTLIDTGTFDYAADAWGYTYGLAGEWYQGDWTYRAGVFDLSGIPNNKNLDKRFHQYQPVAELERRFSIGGRSGAVRVTGFLTRGRMARFTDALALAEATGSVPDVSLVRHYRSRGGVSVNAEQEITADLSGFLRAGWADGTRETYEFTDVDRTLAAGLSLKGAHWGRKDDIVGLAGIVNEASRQSLAYLAAGGLEVLIGDGRLPHPGTERILETYYNLAALKDLRLTFDYQLVVNPAYNRDRGPVSVLGLRVHFQR